MKTPAGNECQYFYGDYYRGRNHEECRMLGKQWKPVFCRTCSVPSILQANACQFMRITLRLIRPWYALFRQRIQVSTICEKTGRADFDAHLGCGECHSVPTVFHIGE